MILVSEFKKALAKLLLEYAMHTAEEMPGKLAEGIMKHIKTAGHNIFHNDEATGMTDEALKDPIVGQKPAD